MARIMGMRAARAPPLALLLVTLAALARGADPQEVELANDAPAVLLDPSNPGAPTMAVEFAEGDSVGAAVCGAAPSVAPSGVVGYGAALAGATVTVTNARDGRDEELVLHDPPSLVQDFIEASYDADTHTLVLTPRSDPDAPAAALAATGGVFTASAEAFEEALGSVRYRHIGRAPDLAPRVVVTRVRDASGAMSLPAVAVVTLVAVNDPPLLDINGPDLPGTSYSVRLSEAERKLSVSLVHHDATLTDADDKLLMSASASIVEAPDGAAETLSVSALDTSISVDAGNGTHVVMRGPDHLHNYLRVLRTLRYRNGAYAPTSNVTRVVLVRVDDMSGASTEATVEVHVDAIERVGADFTVPLPAVCSGHGVAAANGSRCDCDTGYEGDLCEIPPCAGNGALVPSQDKVIEEADEGTAHTPALKCECNALYSGENCTVACSNHGYVNGGECACYEGWAGGKCEFACPACDFAHSICVLSADADGARATVCKCDAGYMGSTCSLQCPCPPYANGRCLLDNFTIPGEERAVCECDSGYVGTGCEFECPLCAIEHSACAPPPTERISERALLARAMACLASDDAFVSTADASPRALELFGPGGVDGSRAMAAVFEQYYVRLPANEAMYRCLGQAGVPWSWVVGDPSKVSVVPATADESAGEPADEMAYMLDDSLDAALDADPVLPRAVPPTHSWAEGDFKRFRWPFVVPTSEALLNATNDALVRALITGADDAVGALLFERDAAATSVAQEVEAMLKYASHVLERGGGVCVCDMAAPNSISGVGWAGSNCTEPCVECVHGACHPEDGSCTCQPGWAGSKCDKECSAQGILTYVNSTVNITEFDSLPYVHGAGVTATGLMNVTDLFGLLSDNNDTMAYCVCDSGWTGPYCDVECGACSSNGECHLDGATNQPICVCDKSRENAKGGLGFAGEQCSLPCMPCGNGTCASDGECACNPGYAGSDCMVECGPEQGPSRGTVNDTAVAPGEGLQGSTAACECDYMWTGDMCEHECPNSYDVLHGRCEPPKEGVSTQAYIVCDSGWTGLDSGGALNCSTACEPCVHGVCQGDGACLCDYGYVWQGPWEGNEDGQLPFPSFYELGFEKGSYHSEYHNCSVAHPCNQNGEWVNATCGIYGNGTVYNGTNCDNGASPVLNGTECTGNWLFGMEYTDADSETWELKRTDDFIGFDRVWRSERIRQSPAVLRTYARYGEVTGGVCVEADDVDAPPNPLPLYGGACVCDSIRNDRFRHPSGSYDFYSQGWAGLKCEIPCAPCSERGLCDSLTGQCVCHEGWTGYRCMTPCEPCEFGSCAYDGSCVCTGQRRLREGSLALRLTRDPFYLERGEHEYTVRGELRRRYVHPRYMTAAVVEDYVRVEEMDCLHIPACQSRTPDTHLPLRPNETFFRYTMPEPDQRFKLEDEHASVLAAIAVLQRDVETVPQSINNTELCDESCMGALDGALQFSVGPLGEGGPERGRSLDSCGDNYEKGLQPWYCDSVVKAHFVRESRLAIGRLTYRALQLRQAIEQEERWPLNNLNERQSLLNTHLRGGYEPELMQWVTYREPSYYKIWIMHQLMYGVSSGADAYTGWNCSVPCDRCDSEHGTCQYDGSCECELGWYGEDCSNKCDCFRHPSTEWDAVAGEGDEVLLSSAGLPVQAHGTCQRNGSCACYGDDSGLRWTGTDCFTVCAPCAHGECQPDGSCECASGWGGTDCSVREYTECLPCDPEHGSCLVDGTCKCDKHWTGTDCSIPCWPCDHGDCQLDGSCLCWPGWTLPDCSRHVGESIVRSDFALGSDGWRAYNNSACNGGGSGESALQRVRTLERDYGAQPAAAVGQGAGCKPRDAAAGVSWDPHMQHLWLSDRLPADRPGEVAYFRAPLAFLGDKSGVYNLTLTYELHLADGAHLAFGAGAEHGQHGGDAALEPPPKNYRSTKERLEAEAALREAAAYNGRGSGMDVILIGGRPVDNVTEPDYDAMTKETLYAWSRESYPELRLNVRWTHARIRATVREYLYTPQLYVGIRAGKEHATPRACVQEHCAINFNFDIVGDKEWTFLSTIPKGFGWTSNDFVDVAEGTHFVKGRGDTPFWLDGGVPRWDYERGEQWRRDDMAAEVGGKRQPEEREYGITYGVQMAMQGGARGSDNYNFDGAWIADERRGWDMLPEVYDAIQIVRGNRTGGTATEGDMRDLLVSLTELLIRADYYTVDQGAAAAELGKGELVRMDHVAWTTRDKFEGQPDAWAEEEHDRYMAWLTAYAEYYDSQYARDYVAQKLEERRLSICSGNGVYASGKGRVCLCEDGFVGDECEMQCLACVHGVCSMDGTCACDAGWTAPLCDVACPPCDYEKGRCEHLPELDARYNATVRRPVSPYRTAEEQLLAYNWDRPSACVCKVGWGGPPYNGEHVEGCTLPCPACNYAQSTCGAFSGTVLRAVPVVGGDGLDLNEEDVYTEAETDAVLEAACLCDEGVVGVTCELLCPDCGGRGVCALDETGEDAVCKCECGPSKCYVGSDCQLECPTNAETGLVCSGVGDCITRNAGDRNERASCECALGFFLDDCSFDSSVCGNFVKEGYEECDSGVGGDGSQLDEGCSDDCTIVPGYECSETGAGTSSCRLV